MRLFIVLVTLVIAASAPAAQGRGAESGAGAAPAANAPPPPPGNTENGKKIYTTYGCYQCHGYVGQGGGGARLAPRPIAFAAFSRYVRLPTGQMPPYTPKVLSNQELADIYAFLLTIPQPPAANSIAILPR